MNKKKVFIAGHNGMVGSALIRALKNHKKYSSIITKSRKELDLINQTDVEEFLDNEKPDTVIIAAATVGGIYANNSFPADFIYQNLMIQNNLIHGSYLAGIKKLLFLGSSCIYPKMSLQPIKEESLLSGPLEPTNEPYAISKIAGIKLCESYNRQYGLDYRSIMPTNLYGPNDNFHLKNSHVIPALIKRFHEAKIKDSQYIKIWGSGAPFREFLYVDDMADASLFLLELSKTLYKSRTNEMLSHVNAGSGNEISIADLALLVKKVVGFKGEIKFDKSMPDGPPRKLLDNSVLNKLGWNPKVNLVDGLQKTYEWFLKKGL